MPTQKFKMHPGMALRGIQGAKWEQKSQIKCVWVNPFHEVDILDILPQFTLHWLRFPSQHAVWVLPEGPNELFDQN